MHSSSTRSKTRKNGLHSYSAREVGQHKKKESSSTFRQMHALTVLLLLILSIINADGYIFHGITQWSGKVTPLRASSRFSPPASVENTPSLSAKIEETSGISYTIMLPKSSGISWGSDLSFRFVYVMDMDPAGEAAKSGIVKKGDYIIGFGNTSLIAQDFDYVITALSRQPTMFNYTFFRGSKDQLMGQPVLDPTDMTVTVRVQEDGKEDRVLTCPGGTNLRRLLVGNGINVYRSLTRWTNCNGKQRCGTCIVEVSNGLSNCSRKALDEEATLRENPETYRLSCVTAVYGDVTVKVQGPVTAAQWTR